VATHYEVLGVSPGASTEDLRRAYLDLARASHPDRATAADAEQASRRMQEVNEAWRVLRDPASRDAYDRSLAARRQQAPAARVATPRIDDDGDLDVPFTSAPAQPGDLGLSFVRALPWLTVTAILVIIFVFTAFAGKHGAKTAEDLAGKCVSSGNVATVDTVPCDGPNDGKVVLVVDRASLCPDGAQRRPVEGDRWLCLEPSTPTTADTSPSTTTTLVP
jgi:hypothetical protein